MTEAHLPINDALVTHRDLATLVLDYGREFTEWAPIPPDLNHLAVPMSGDCFRASLVMAMEQPSRLHYVEGFAVHRFSEQPVEHAWVATDDCVVYDPTWPITGTKGHHGEVAYIGIALDLRWASRTTMARARSGVLHLLDRTTVEDHIDFDLGGVPDGVRSPS